MKPKIDLRWKAREHLENADRLLKRTNIHKLRYAALEMRMCIEALFYELVLTYYDILPNTIKKKWKIKNIIDEILQFIPGATQSITLYIGEEGQPNVEPAHTTSRGTDYRLDPRWAIDAYNALGFFLHSPNIDQLEEGKDHDSEKLLAKLQEIQPELWKVINSRIFNVRLDRDTVSIVCDCGFTIKRRRDVLQRPIICMNCGEVYEHKVENGNDRFVVEEHILKCDYCGKESALKAKFVVERRPFRCRHCKGEYRFVRAFVAEPMQKEKLRQLMYSFAPVCRTVFTPAYCF